GIAGRVLGNDSWIDFPFRLEPSFCLVGLATVGQCPDDSFVFGPVFGNHHSEYPPSWRRIKMCRLALIDIVQIEPVVGADRDVDFFFRISIEISEIQRVSSVRIHLPAVEGGTDILTSRIFDLSAVNDEDTKQE